MIIMKHAPKELNGDIVINNVSTASELSDVTEMVSMFYVHITQVLYHR